MLGRYAELKAQLPPGTILFYQVGTFFETFEEDAKRISQALSIRLTSQLPGRVRDQGRHRGDSGRRGLDWRVHGDGGTGGAVERGARALVAAGACCAGADRVREPAQGARRGELGAALDF